MKYNGIELEEVTEPQIFDPPKSKWSETEWHKPTREYLGLEDK